MNYKLIVLAPSTGGKSTLMRYLREHTDLHVVETDEEVMKANNNVWPDDNNYKDQVLLPKVTNEIIKQDDVLFIASYIPTELLRKAKERGFKIIILQLTLEELKRRNAKRMNEESYDDATPWFKGQLEDYQRLSQEGLVDSIIDGHQNISQIVGEITRLKDASF